MRERLEPFQNEGNELSLSPTPAGLQRAVTPVTPEKIQIERQGMEEESERGGSNKTVLISCIQHAPLFDLNSYQLKDAVCGVYDNEVIH